MQDAGENEYPSNEQQTNIKWFCDFSLVDLKSMAMCARGCGIWGLYLESQSAPNLHQSCTASRRALPELAGNSSRLPLMLMRAPVTCASGQRTAGWAPHARAFRRGVSNVSLEMWLARFRSSFNNTPQAPHVNSHVRPEFTCECMYGRSRALICEFTCAVFDMLSYTLPLICDPTRVLFVKAIRAATCEAPYVNACIAVLN